jgi:hypothetical protein
VWTVWIWLNKYRVYVYVRMVVSLQWMENVNVVKEYSIIRSQLVTINLIVLLVLMVVTVVHSLVVILVNHLHTVKL